MGKSSIMIGVLLAIATGGCSLVKVMVDHDPTVDFSKFKTYKWTMATEQKSGNILDDDPILRLRIRKTVDEHLATRGFVKQADGEVDFVIGAFATVANRTTVTQINDYYDYEPGWGRGYHYRYPQAIWSSPSRTYVYRYEQGTLIIDISDPTSRQLVWRATADAELDETRTQTQRDALLAEAVTKMFDEFPPE